MSQFQDEHGDTWQLALNVGVARRLKKEHDFDVGRLADKDAFTEFYLTLASDPVFVSDLLQVLCAEQVEERGLTPDDFDRRLAGDALDSACAALIECVINFTNKKFRPTLRRLAERSNEGAAELNRQNIARLDRLDLAAECGKQYGDTPASSASGPTPTPTENSPTGPEA